MTTTLEKRPRKALSSPTFSLNIDGVKGVCPADRSVPGRDQRRTSTSASGHEPTFGTLRG